MSFTTSFTQGTVPRTDASKPCQWCGRIHTGVCPLVEEIEYYPGGSVKRVKFKQAALAPRGQQRFEEQQP